MPDSLVTVVNVQWFGSEALELTYKSAREEATTLLRSRSPGTVMCLCLLVEQRGESPNHLRVESPPGLPG